MRPPSIALPATAALLFVVLVSAPARAQGGDDRTRKPGDKDAYSSAHVVVTGGPHAGIYDLTTDIKCQLDKATKSRPRDIFEAHMGAWESGKRHFDAKALTGVWVRVKNATAGSPQNLPFVSISFGPSDGDSYSAKPETQAGTAVVVLKQTGTNATMTFDAKTKDGIGLKGTVTCKEFLAY